MVRRALALFGALALGAGGVAPAAAQATSVPRGEGRAGPWLPGTLTGSAPWPRETEHLAARLRAIGLPALPAEGSALHTHQRLTIWIGGRPTVVPARIGIDEIARFISPLHTHDTTGVIHIESPTTRPFVLGQFFDVWGVRFTSACIGGYCSGPTDSLRVFANGARVTGDPRQLPLEQGQEIAVTFGRVAAAPAVRSR